MAPLIIGGTLSCPPGTQLTRLGISYTHLPQLNVQAESVKYVDIASYYNYVHKPLSGIGHRCERKTVIGVFTTVTMAWVD